MRAVPGVLIGLGAYVRVLRYIGRLRLLQYVLLTAAIALGLVVLLGLGLVLIYRSSGLSGLETDVSLAVQLWTLIKLVAWAALGVLLFKRLVLVLAAPWLSPLARRVSAFRQNQLQRPEARSSRVGLAPKPAVDSAAKTATLGRAVRMNLWLTVVELAWTLPLLALSLVPGVAAVTGPLLLLVSSYFVGAGVLDLCVEERLNYDASRRYLRQHRGLALGIGLGFTALLLTGIGFLLAPAWSVAAGAWGVEKSYRESDVTN